MTPRALISRTLTVIVLAAAVAALVAAVTATAEPDGEGARLSAAPGNPLGISNSKNGVALVSAGDMLPGQLSTGTVTLTNIGSVDADFSLERGKLADVIGLGGGSLSSVLALNVEEITPGGAPRSVYNGTLAGMGRVDLGDFAKGSARSFRFTVAFPEGQTSSSATEATTASPGPPRAPTSSGRRPSRPPRARRTRARTRATSRGGRRAARRTRRRAGAGPAAATRRTRAPAAKRGRPRSAPGTGSRSRASRC